MGKVRDASAPGGADARALVDGKALGLQLVDVWREGEIGNEDWTALAVAFVASAITAFVAVKWLLRYIQTHRFTVFAWYRFVLGAALLLMVP